MLWNLVEYGASVGYFSRLKLGRCVSVQLDYSVCPSEQQQNVQIRIKSNDHRMAIIQYERRTHQIFIIYVYSFTLATDATMSPTKEKQHCNYSKNCFTPQKMKKARPTFHIEQLARQDVPLGRQGWLRGPPPWYMILYHIIMFHIPVINLIIFIYHR